MLWQGYRGQFAEWLDSIGDETLPARRKSILMLQWLVVIGTSYLSLFSGSDIRHDPRVLLLVAMLMSSGIALQRLPERFFQSVKFSFSLVFVDSVLILMGIALKHESPWELFLLFFLCLYIAGIGESLIKAIFGCLLFSFVFTFVSLSAQKGDWLDAEILLRIPFLFGVSTLYAYLAHQAKREKRRADDAECAETVKRRLVSGLAHDIKSPLSVVKGFAEMIGLSLAGMPGQEHNLSCLQRIGRNIDRVLRLVMGFLDASQAETGATQQLETPVALNWLIQEVAREEALEMFSSGITLNLELDPNLPEILGEVLQVERVLWNLLSNAIKFTPRNGRVEVKTASAEGQVRVMIRDTGVGIATEDLPLLFSEYRRLKGSGSTEGSGLGLYIVKNIVKSHGGTVKVESELDKGTTFVLTFPIAAKLAPVTDAQIKLAS
jgi:signal transduction histidine kinase